MKKILKSLFAIALVLSIMGTSTNAATVDLTTSDTERASDSISAKGAKIIGSNSSSSAYSVRFYGQYKNSAGVYATDTDVKVVAGGTCPTTYTYKFTSNKTWRLLLKPNAFNVTGCSASGTITAY